MQRKHSGGLFGFAPALAASTAALGVCLLAAPAAAQPAIGGVTGQVSHNQTIVITGNGFGAKASAPPLVWEDFSDRALDPKLVTRGGSVVLNSDNLRHPFSTRNARSDYKASGYYFGYDEASAPRWFVQYWVKLAPNWHWGTSTYGGGDDGLANIKFFRMFPRGDRNYSNVGYSAHGFTGADVLRFVENGVQNYLGVNFKDWFGLDTWHNVQIEYGENSGAGQQNGTLRLWVDGRLRDSTTTLDTNHAADGPAVDKRPYIIGFYDSWGPSDAAVSNMYAYYGDIYVDRSWARVEIGNSAIYAECTHREILVPTAWSGESISARVQQGTFAPGQTAYLYVVDDTGRVNTAGHPVTFTVSGTAPSAPTGLRVIK